MKTVSSTRLERRNGRTETYRLRMDEREDLKDGDKLRRNWKRVSRRSERSGDQLLTKSRIEEDEEDELLSTSKGVTGERMETR